MTSHRPAADPSTVADVFISAAPAAIAEVLPAGTEAPHIPKRHPLRDRQLALAKAPECPAHILDALADSTDARVHLAIAANPNTSYDTAAKIADLCLAAFRAHPGVAVYRATLTKLCGTARPSTYLPKLLALPDETRHIIDPAALKGALQRAADPAELRAVWNTGELRCQVAVAELTCAGETGLPFEDLWSGLTADRKIAIATQLDLEGSEPLPRWLVDTIVDLSTIESSNPFPVLPSGAVDRYTTERYLASGIPRLVWLAIENMFEDDTDLIGPKLLESLVTNDHAPLDLLTSLWRRGRLTERQQIAVVAHQQPLSWTAAKNLLTSDISDDVAAHILAVAPDHRDMFDQWMTGCFSHQPTVGAVARLAALAGIPVSSLLTDFQPLYVPEHLALTLLNLCGAGLFTPAMQRGEGGIPADVVADYTQRRLSELGDNPDVWYMASIMATSMTTDTVDDFLAAVKAVAA